MADPVWMLVMFDLPVKTAGQRKEANAFRNLLLDLGFSKVQLSVYACYFPNASQSGRPLRIIKENLGDGGAVRVFRMADSTWSAQLRLESLGQEVEVEEIPSQLYLFE